jgi:hypothetical protein
MFKLFHQYVEAIGAEIVPVVGGVLSTVIETNFSIVVTSEIVETISFICLTASTTLPANQT